MSTASRLLRAVAVAEVLTGLALVIVPSVVAQLLLGEGLAGAALTVARVAGLALTGLGLACWPGPPILGMLFYGITVAIGLALAGLSGAAIGPLLWPAVALHAVLALLMASELAGSAKR